MRIAVCALTGVSARGQRIGATSEQPQRPVHPESCNDNLRFGVFDGNGRGLPYYLPDVRGDGHPSFSPDGKWICTDTAGTRPENCSIILCAGSGGPAVMVMDGYFRSEGHASFNAVRERASGMSVMDALQKPKAKNRKTERHKRIRPGAGTAVPFFSIGIAGRALSST